MMSVLSTLGRYFALWTLALLPPPSRLRTGWDPQWSNVWGGEVKQYWRGRLGCAPYNASAIELQAEDRDCYDAAFLWWSLPLIVVLRLYERELPAPWFGGPGAASSQGAEVALAGEFLGAICSEVRSPMMPPVPTGVRL